MQILLLGGTGAMGAPLQNCLSKLGHMIYVTSRSQRVSSINNINYLCGNAHDPVFLKEILKKRFDVIVDFMVYGVEEFKSKIDILLKNTDQYIFISSSRVYAPSEGSITEDCPRLIDVCNDSEYLRTDEYALSKARQENLLYQSIYDNYTIVRPSLTYNSERLQYALGEKELWLYRLLHKEKIVFPKNMKNIYNTLSYGADVAKAISLLVGNKKAYGETIHIAGAEPITWDEVNNIYCEVIHERYDYEPEFKLVDDWKKISNFMGNYYQIRYARAVNRKFDNSKLYTIIGKMDFTSPRIGLNKCLNEFLNGDKIFSNISWRDEAYFNRITGDIGIIEEFNVQNKIKYLIGRYSPYFQIKDMIHLNVK